MEKSFEKLQKDFETEKHSKIEILKENSVKSPNGISYDEHCETITKFNKDFSHQYSKEIEKQNESIEQMNQQNEQNVFQLKSELKTMKSMNKEKIHKLKEELKHQQLI
jgi:hypothetical protein